MSEQGSRHLRCGVLAAAVLIGAAPAGAVEPAELIDQRLEARSIEFVGLYGGELSFFDEDGRLQRAEASRFVSVRFTEREAAEPGASEAWPGVLRLTDGQVIRGRFGGADEEGRLLWETEHFGRLAVEVDRVSRLARSAGEEGTPFAIFREWGPQPLGGLEAPATVSGDDRIVLANGDLVSGFIVAFGPAAVTVETDGQELALPWDRVGGLWLANPPRREAGLWLRLTDGSTVRVEKMEMDDEAARALGFGGREVSVPGDRIAALDFAQRHRVVGLSELEPAVVSGARVFGVEMPPRLRSDAAELHAPLTMRFELPAGARRFAAIASLDAGDLEWADLTLRIADGRGELAAERLNAERPRARINVELRDPVLEVRLDEGINGPVRDRLTLERAVLLVETGR